MRMRSLFLSCWRVFTLPPEDLPVERRRSFEIMAEIYLLTLGLQALVSPLLYISGHVMLGHLNLLCLVGYSLALVLHRRLFLATALMLKLGTFILFVTYGATTTGHGGSLIYFLLFAEVEVMLADLRRRTKIAATIFMIAISLAILHLQVTPTLTLSPPVPELSDLGLGVVYAMLCAVILRVLSITDRHEHRYRRDAMHDSLTLVLNRRAIFERASFHWKTGRTFAVLLVDADRFKDINDNFGHTAGDAVLHHLAGLLRESLRSDDSIGRVGGEEFLILLPGAGRNEALAAATRIRDRLAHTPCQFDDHSLPVTLSMGIARSREGLHLSDVIELADRRLYAAKSAGRDQVVAEGHANSATSRNAQRLTQGVTSALQPGDTSPAGMDLNVAAGDEKARAE